VDNFTKQIYEEFTIDANFGANFTEPETITSQTVTAVDKSGIDVSASVTNQASVSNDGSKVSVLVRGGTAENSPYKISFRCITSNGNKWEYDVQMKIKEI